MPKVKTVNVKYDMPDKETARSRLREALEAARREGVHVIKVVHGYGSTGVGGVLQSAIRKSLSRLEKDGKIRHYVYGENWDVFHEAAQALLDECPDLSRDGDLGQGNAGVTLVLL